MGIFSFSWFKSEYQKSREKLDLEKKLVDIQLAQKELYGVQIRKKPYVSLKFTSNVLTIILNDGSILSKPGATELDFQRARVAQTEQQLFDIASSVEGMEEQKAHEMEVKKAELVIKGVDILKTLPDFEVDGNTVYLKGTKRSLPALLVEKFATIASLYEGRDVSKDEEYQALKRFFLWCCLNPRAEVADRLYDFLSRNKMKITKQGFFIGLRNVANVAGSNHPMIDFITNVYHKVKAVWRDDPKYYEVYQNGNEYEFHRTSIGVGVHIGNLQQLYLNLPNMVENRYTDGWTHTFDIRVGKVVAMKPEDCNWSTQDCATAGLHFAGHTFPYVLYGDTTVFTLHNPMKVVGIGSEKGRCWEYLPFMTTNVSEADEIMNSAEFDFLQLDEKYAVEELEGLEEKVKQGFAVEAKKYEFSLPTISTSEIKNIVASLAEIKTILSGRVVKIDYSPAAKVVEQNTQDEDYNDEDDDYWEDEEDDDEYYEGQFY